MDTTPNVRVIPKSAHASPPTTVTDAMRLCLEDGRALLEAGEGVDFYSVGWLATNEDGRREVCPAGAVMAQRFQIEAPVVTPAPIVTPAQFEPPWRRTFEAIQEVREGCFGRAYERMAGPGTPAARAAAVFSDDAYAVRYLARIFEDEVFFTLEAKSQGPDPHAYFTGADGYAKFLDRLEAVTLPAIERAEAEVAWFAKAKAHRERARAAGPNATH